MVTVRSVRITLATLLIALGLALPGALATAPSASAIQVGSCGFISKCVYLDRNEQLVVAGGVAGGAGVLLCGTSKITCVATGTIVGAVGTYISIHGICGKKNPYMKVVFAPVPLTGIDCVNSEPTSFPPGGGGGSWRHTPSGFRGGGGGGGGGGA